jgi:hypothetical protein
MNSKNESQGPDGFRTDEQSDKRTDTEGGAEAVRKANENIRKAQGEGDSTSSEEPIDGRRGNRPRFDRDR